MIEYFGYKIIEDNLVQEIRMPKEVIEYFKNIEILNNIESIFKKEIKKQSFSGVIYVPKSLIGKKAIVLILK